MTLSGSRTSTSGSAGSKAACNVVGGFGVTYNRLDDIVLAPVRVGVGWRQGVSVGYLQMSARQFVESVLEGIHVGNSYCRCRYTRASKPCSASMASSS